MSAKEILVYEIKSRKMIVYERLNLEKFVIPKTNIKPEHIEPGTNIDDDRYLVEESIIPIEKLHSYLLLPEGMTTSNLENHYSQNFPPNASVSCDMMESDGEFNKYIFSTNVGFNCADDESKWLKTQFMDYPQKRNELELKIIDLITRLNNITLRDYISVLWRKIKRTLKGS